MISHLRIKHRKCSRLPCKLVPDWGKQSGHYLFPLLLATLCIKRKRFHNNFPHPFHPIMVYLVANLTYPPVRELLLFAGWEKISKDGVAGKNSSRVSICNFCDKFVKSSSIFIYKNVLLLHMHYLSTVFRVAPS